MNKLYEAACSYAENGIAVFPLKPKSKEPITKNGVKDATTNQDQIRKWWTQFPDANVGIAMGEKSGIFGLDGDYDDGLREEIEKELPPTITCRSPTRGYKNFHKFYKYPENGIKNGKKLERGLTVRSDGYYFCTAPSIHPDGGEYKFEGKSLGDGLCEEAPEWMISHPGWKEQKKEEVREGGRHDALKDLATHLRKSGTDEAEIKNKLIELNSKFIDGPKPIEEINNVIKWVIENVEICNEVTPKSPSYEVVEKFLMDNGFYSDNGEMLLRYYQKDFYRYKNGGENYYQKIDDSWLEDRLYRWLVSAGCGAILENKKLGAINKLLRVKPRFIQDGINTPCLYDGTHWIESKYLVPLKNGLFNAKKFATTGEIELLPHDPKFFCTYSLPYEFNKEAKCEIFDSVCQEIFRGKEEIKAFEEVLGVHIFMPFLIEKFFVLCGDGGNGKGVIYTIMECLLGRNNISNVTIDCFNSSNFAFQNVVGKLANIIPDMHDVSEIDEGTLKAYVSREPMLFNRKNKPHITAAPSAFLTICTNQLPRFNDKSEGIWRRMVIFRFDKTIPKEQQNPKYREHWFWQESGELPGILNKALAGLRRVVNRGFILETQHMVAEVESYKHELNYVAQFANDCLKYGPGCKETTRQIYDCYRKMVITDGGKPFSRNYFTRQLLSEAKKTNKEIEVSKKVERVDAYVGRFLCGAELNEYGKSFMFVTSNDANASDTKHSVQSRCVDN